MSTDKKWQKHGKCCFSNHLKSDNFFNNFIQCLFICFTKSVIFWAISICNSFELRALWNNSGHLIYGIIWAIWKRSSNPWILYPDQIQEQDTSVAELDIIQEYGYRFSVKLLCLVSYFVSYKFLSTVCSAVQHLPLVVVIGE